MKRVIVDYSKLTGEILNLLVEKFPDGYDDSNIVRFKNAKGEAIEAVEVRTVDTIFLVKISTKLSDRIINYDEDDELANEEVSIDAIKDMDMDDDSDDDDEDDSSNDNDSDSDSDNEQEKEQITESIDEIKSTLKQVEKAINLDKQLPESQKSNNSHLNDFKKEYSSFFDQDSGNNTEQGLKEVKDYLKEEIRS